LTFDCVSFYQYLETILASNSGKVHRSPWLFTDAAETIFNVARRRVYVRTGPSSSLDSATAQKDSTSQNESARQGDDEYWTGTTEEEEQALLEAMHHSEQTADDTQIVTKPKAKTPSWLPPGIEPVLEEQPKWHLLAEVMDEIEQDLYNDPVLPGLVAYFCCHSNSWAYRENFMQTLCRMTQS
jgi:DNA excision repair protein ERCC-4